jgi:addiction module HigA family antidote
LSSNPKLAKKPITREHGNCFCTSGRTLGLRTRNVEHERVGFSASDLARQVQAPSNRISKIINGREPITGEMALRLAHFFGTSARFWMNLQAIYELQIPHRASGQSIKTLPTLTTPLKPSPTLSDQVAEGSTKGTEQIRADEHKRSIPSEGYMRLPAVLSIFPVSRSTWWAGHQRRAIS